MSESNSTNYEDQILANPSRGFSVKMLQARWKIGNQKIKLYIKQGLLRAIDFGILGGRHQVRILPEDVKRFEEMAAVRAVQEVRRRKSQDDGISETVRKILDAE